MKREDGLPRNPRIRYRFRAKPFDFMFQWMIGSSTTGGAEIGEAMYAASRIPDGDGEAWYREFAELGARVAERADASAAAGHRVSAREAWLRAYVYYRAAPLFLNPRTDQRYRAAYETARVLFRKGAELLDPPLEPIAIPYRSAELPGYIASPTDGSEPRRAPTLLMIGGGDTFVEDLYYYIVPPAKPTRISGRLC